MKKYFYLITALILIISANTLYGVIIKKNLVYKKYTLKDNYKYKNRYREFQWDKISRRLDSLETFVNRNVVFAKLINYKNNQGAAPLTPNATINNYGIHQDKFGTSKYQSIPLYSLHNKNKPARYSRDGALVAIVGIDKKFFKIEHHLLKGKWYVPRKYLRVLDATNFTKTIFIDRKNQNITTLENIDNEWNVKSMNPATTGLQRPPHQRRTPIGIFVLQGKRPKMFYTKDGTNKIGGYAPHSSRFCGGAYIHGIPVNLPDTTIIEYAYSLGTSPRSHMCVRNASSHAKFIYDWGTLNETLIYVIE